ncbi:hypothetical protein JRQ81_017702 [Phrynocephalus forsythii]|uniref:Uncharacterized protein n=1 Tax=Phrynocephalus forsythii TaxID=171643 RepID=A0A9Q0XSU0_9SAUR|nr:hypothetical protein JRQ81_017702 [Phrynocephalus forsythii]
MQGGCREYVRRRRPGRDGNGSFLGGEGGLGIIVALGLCRRRRRRRRRGFCHWWRRRRRLARRSLARVGWPVESRGCDAGERFSRRLPKCLRKTVVEGNRKRAQKWLKEEPHSRGSGRT